METWQVMPGSTAYRPTAATCSLAEAVKTFAPQAVVVLVAIR